MGFKDKIQIAMLESKKKSQDKRLQSILKGADLCLYSEAWRIVYPEIELILGRSDWSEPAIGQSMEEFKDELRGFISRVWGESYNPRMYTGSVATIFNLTIIYFICRHELVVKEDTFFVALDWALEESSMQDIEAYFSAGIFSDSHKSDNLSILLPAYCAKFFPDRGIEEHILIVTTKLENLADLHEKGENSNLLFFSSGLRNSNIKAGSGPQANLVRYLEYYDALFLDEEYLAPLFNMSHSLDYVEKSVDEHWLFCSERILIFSEKNYENGISSIISQDDVDQITFGYAMTGITKDGKITSAAYKMYMSIALRDGSSILRFQYLGATESEAKRVASERIDDYLEVIGNSWECEWSDEVIDEFDHYETTTTTTTTYTYWGFTD